MAHRYDLRSHAKDTVKVTTTTTAPHSSAADTPPVDTATAPVVVAGMSGTGVTGDTGANHNADNTANQNIDDKSSSSVRTRETLPHDGTAADYMDEIQPLLNERDDDRGILKESIRKIEQTINDDSYDQVNKVYNDSVQGRRNLLLALDQLEIIYYEMQENEELKKVSEMMNNGKVPFLTDKRTLVNLDTHFKQLYQDYIDKKTRAKDQALTNQLLANLHGIEKRVDDIITALGATNENQQDNPYDIISAMDDEKVLGKTLNELLTMAQGHNRALKELGYLTVGKQSDEFDDAMRHQTIIDSWIAAVWALLERLQRNDALKNSSSNTVQQGTALYHFPAIGNPTRQAAGRYHQSASMSTTSTSLNMTTPNTLGVANGQATAPVSGNIPSLAQSGQASTAIVSANQGAISSTSVAGGTGTASGRGSLSSSNAGSSIANSSNPHNYYNPNQNYVNDPSCTFANPVTQGVNNLFKKAQLPEFAGQRSAYPRFRSLITAVLDSCYATEIQKSFCLYNSLTGEAKERIQGIQIEKEGSYTEMLSTLDKFYLDISFNIREATRILKSIPEIKEGDCIAVENAILNLNKAYNILEAVQGQNISLSDCQDIINKFPIMLRFEFNMDVYEKLSESEKTSPLKHLVKFLNGKSNFYMREAENQKARNAINKSISKLNLEKKS